MNKLKCLFFIFILFIVIFSSCKETPTGPIPTPTVSYQAIDNGGTLRLSWTALENVDGYKIYIYGINGTKDTTITTTSTSYDVSTPCKKIEVCGYKDETEGDKWSLDLTPTITPTIEVYNASDPDPSHPSAFGFKSDGTVIRYALSDSSTWTSIDFWIDSGDSLNAPKTHPQMGNVNKEGNASKEATTTDFDAIFIADAPGTGYLTVTKLITGAVYCFWLDEDDDGNWDPDEHFGKIKAMDYTSPKWTFKIAYQKVPGLRWCVTK